MRSVALSLFFVTVLCGEEGFQPLVQGQSLEGWIVDTPGVWRVEGGVIIGTSPGLKYNDFLRTRKHYRDFILKLSFRLKNGMGNSGIQFRSKPVPNSHEVEGYQADIGEKYWGALYDESRRRKILAQPAPEKLASLRQDGWNEYVILAQGGHIALELNGVRTVDYFETDAKIERDGFLALQVHSGPPLEVEFKDLRIKELEPAAREARVEEWRGAIRAKLFVPDPLPALQTRSHGRFAPASGVVAERVTYETQFGMRVPAILYLPEKPAGRIPALIVVNGHGGDKYSWYAGYSGVLFAKAGAAVLTYDPVGEGERNIRRESGTRAHDKIQEPAELARRMGGLMMTDLMQAVSYLASRPEIDAGRIGAMGYSMGSFVLGLACAVDTRLRACVLSGGGNLDEAEGYWDQSKPMCQGTPYRSLGFLGDRPAAIYAMHAERGPTLIFNGGEDSVVAIPRYGAEHLAEVRRRAAVLRGRTEGLFEVGFVEGVSHRPFFVTRPVALWLEQQLDFPGWDRKQIEFMPEIRIGDWAQAHGVAMDPLYATEHREGGTRALDAGVPGLSREQLSVFTPQAWQHEKDRMVYEKWMEHARRRLQ